MAIPEKIDVEKLIQAVPLLAGVDVDGLSGILEGAKLYKISEGGHVYRAGDPCVGFYSLVSGTVHVGQSTDQGGTILLRKIRPGQSFGLSDFLQRARHRMEATLVEEGLVFRFDGNRFRERLQQGSPHALSVIRAISRQMESNLQALDERLSHIFENPESSIGEFERHIPNVTKELRLDDS